MLYRRKNSARGDAGQRTSAEEECSGFGDSESLEEYREEANGAVV